MQRGFFARTRLLSTSSERALWYAHKRKEGKNHDKTKNSTDNQKEKEKHSWENKESNLGESAGGGTFFADNVTGIRGPVSLPDSHAPAWRYLLFPAGTDYLRLSGIKRSSSWGGLL